MNPVVNLLGDLQVNPLTDHHANRRFSLLEDRPTNRPVIQAGSLLVSRRDCRLAGRLTSLLVSLLTNRQMSLRAVRAAIPVVILA